jgi:RHS repeat-associated protein
MAVRDLDLTGDATLEERGYFIQNWRADLVGVMRPDGVLPGWFKYSAYGKHHEILLADVDDGSETGTRDGGITGEDFAYFYAQFEFGTPEADANNDGGTTIEDLLLFLELYEAGGPATTSRVMYAGYQYDSKVDLYHVRHRVYTTDLGSWLTQDFLGYVDGMSLYEYVSSTAVIARDPSGQQSILDQLLDNIHGFGGGSLTLPPIIIPIGLTGCAVQVVGTFSGEASKCQDNSGNSKSQICGSFGLEVYVACGKSKKAKLDKRDPRTVRQERPGLWGTDRSMKQKAKESVSGYRDRGLYGGGNTVLPKCADNKNVLDNIAVTGGVFLRGSAGFGCGVQGSVNFDLTPFIKDPNLDNLLNWDNLTSSFDTATGIWA